MLLEALSTSLTSALIGAFAGAMGALLMALSSTGSRHWAGAMQCRWDNHPTAQ